MVKSPQWFDTFRFNSTDSFGRPRTLTANFNYPLMATVGIGYTGFDRWTFASDFHFINYAGTNGFSQTGFDATGAVKGLGWNNVYAVALGARVSADRLRVLAGRLYVQHQPDRRRQRHVQRRLALLLEHTLYLGASYKLTRNVLLSIAYAHAFENSIQGPIVNPTLGAIPASTIRSTVSADTVSIGATVKF